MFFPPMMDTSFVRVLDDASHRSLSDFLTRQKRLLGLDISSDFLTRQIRSSSRKSLSCPRARLIACSSNPDLEIFSLIWWSFNMRTYSRSSWSGLKCKTCVAGHQWCSSSSMGRARERQVWKFIWTVTYAPFLITFVVSHADYLRGRLCIWATLHEGTGVEKKSLTLLLVRVQSPCL
jgi:hypothetical protein